jgi:glycosyltransferase involved in cell wall biosynthesis
VSGRTRRDVAGLGADAALVPNGVALDEIRDAPTADRDVDVLFVGRYIPEKNADLLVRTVDRLRGEGDRVACTLVGDGPEREAVASLVRERDLGDRVTLLDPLDSYADVLGLMKAADVLALPSEREGFGMVALEALACGTPVATLDHPRNAATELVAEGETGAVAEKSARAFAAGLRRARACDPVACRATAREYDWDRVVARAEAAYRAAADGTGVPQADAVAEAGQPY